MSLNRFGNILLVEDDNDTAVLIQRFLRKAKVQNDIHRVPDGAAAIHYLRQQCSPNHTEPGLVLLDIDMPEKNGVEVLSDIKGDETLAHLPVVMLTSTEEPEIAAQCRQLGCAAYVTKMTAFADFGAFIMQLWLLSETVCARPKVLRPAGA